MPGIDDLQPGAVCRGTVTSAAATVLFVDLDGASGVVTAPNLSWKRFTHAEQVAQVGEEVVAVVLSVDTERDQVSLSLKELQHDPFLDFAATQLGATLTGVVEKITPIGLFLEVQEDISGLLPKAECPAAELDSVQVGDHYSVVVTSINLQERRVALSLAD
ncbi:S1 RNA-binding domain-containing protein [Streptomyces smyrnaeus]|uniref:S1 RNA-binding domain-containing protein n=1 Tax=Streptomyces TaxID=1883 RepID=UPI001B38EF7A|nr:MULTISPECIES: S1 RNA-binding domain-containing protein [unclassified Streptomyces]MBQ0866790.1 S1 RNA-binding domain-containing protein [Streptomyces sp. RK75]MBQ1121615.1 S1 RNA-binding domain-containing protein [Streptomyces sp. B15]